MPRKRKVMVFGVFDGLHEGHRAFLRLAKAQGDYLIAVVAQDHIVEHLKGRRPRLNLAERFRHLKNVDHVDAVVVGDSQLRKWDVLDIHRPQVIALGYDQEVLREELERYFVAANWRAEIKIMNAHEGDKFHSSLLDK